MFGPVRSCLVYFATAQMILGALRVARVSSALRLALFIALFISPGSARAAIFIRMGDLPDGECFSQATAVSGDGMVAVGDSDSGGSNFEAFRRPVESGIAGLGYLPIGGTQSVARDISADGSVVVGYGDTFTSLARAYRWTSDGGMVNLGHLPGGDHFSNAFAHAVSADGSVVTGGSSSASGFQAYRWTAGTGMVGLGDLPGGSFSSNGVGISSDGTIVVGNGTSASGAEAMYWTAASGMVGIGDLPGGTFLSVAEDVSDDGSVIIGRAVSASGNEAFRWTSSGGMVGLGDLPGGEFWSGANDVTADGSTVVGFGSNVFFNRSAIIWDAANGMRDLRTVLINDYGLDLSGWTLHSAQGISDDGNVIVGTGTNPDGISEGWMVHLVSPFPGDFSQDGSVDAADYVIWRSTEGTPESDTDWSTDFGRAFFESVGECARTCSEPLSHTVPEPSTMILLSFAIACCCLQRGGIKKSIPATH